MVLETLAVTGGTPNARRVGNVISVPDPTTVLMVPAASPARPMAIASRSDTQLLRGGSGRRWRRAGRRRRLARRRCRRRRRVGGPAEIGGARVGRAGGLGDRGLDGLVRLAHLGVR